jgi:hypothetical protein
LSNSSAISGGAGAAMLERMLATVLMVNQAVLEF